MHPLLPDRPRILPLLLWLDGPPCSFQRAQIDERHERRATVGTLEGQLALSKRVDDVLALRQVECISEHDRTATRLGCEHAKDRRWPQSASTRRGFEDLGVLQHRLLTQVNGLDDRLGLEADS